MTSALPTNGPGSGWNPPEIEADERDAIMNEHLYATPQAIPQQQMIAGLLAQARIGSHLVLNQLREPAPRIDQKQAPYKDETHAH